MVMNGTSNPIVANPWMHPWQLLLLIHGNQWQYWTLQHQYCKTIDYLIVIWGTIIIE